MNLAERVVEELLKDAGKRVIDFGDDEEKDEYRERWVPIAAKVISEVLDSVLVPVEETDESDEEEGINESIESLGRR